MDDKNCIWIFFNSYFNKNNIQEVLKMNNNKDGVG